MTKLCFFLTKAILLLAAVTAFRLEASDNTSLSEFRAGVLGVYQGEVGSSYSVELAWAPRFDLGLLTLRGDLGLTVLKNTFGDRFLVFNYEALLDISLLPLLSFEVGGGLQSWLGNGGSKPIATANLLFPFPGVIDEVYLGYSRLFLAGGVDEVHAGIGIAL